VNKVVIKDANPEELKHYGKLGMKWGMRSASRRTNSLEKKVGKTVRKFDKGKDMPEGHVQKVSKNVRSQKYKIDRKIKRAEKYLAKSAKADAAKVINRFNKDPVKKAAVEEYVNSLKTNSAILAELRSQMMDIRIK